MKKPKIPRVSFYCKHGTVYAKVLTPLGDCFEEFRDAMGPTSALDKVERAIHVPLEDLASVLARLRGAGFDVAEHASLHEATAKLVASAVVEVERAARAAALHQLYPYQKEGVKWLASRRAALLADEMGLGKTAQLLLGAPQGPVLVVSSAIAIGTWEREIRTWQPGLIPRVLSRRSFAVPLPPHVGIISYDSLPFDAVPQRAMTLIADEAHALKSAKSKRTKHFRLLAGRVLAQGGRVWLATGTPLENRPQELWHVLHAAGLAYRAFGSWERFVELFGGTPAGPRGKWVERRDLRCEGGGARCASLQGKELGTCGNDPDLCVSCKLYATEKPRVFVPSKDGEAGKHGFAWTIASPEVKELLRPVMLRRTRAEVLPDLPSKTYATLEAQIDSPGTLAECDRMLSLLRPGESAAELHARLSKPAEFATVSALLEKLSVAKIPSLLEHVERFEDEGHPLVVFSPHRRPVEALSRRKGWLTITGDDSAEARAQKVAAFQTGERGIIGIAGTIGAMGTSITLTRASCVLFAGLDWNPKKNDQAEDRVCRIGQTRGVLVYDLLSSHPLDERIREVLRSKDTLAESAGL